ncbi:hypothetical protein [Allosphingosinicella sp.]|jgi:hypothetical protein|uniref:hypothetical protein n=1 Tax=Allosphingosinicella sp. TaxID=2823234 RepID=UPI002F196393
MAITERRNACKNSERFVRPAELQRCDTEVIDAAEALLPRARGNDRLNALFPDMFESLVYAKSGGEDALTWRVVVMAAYGDLALLRATILTGVDDRRLHLTRPEGTAGPGLFALPSRWVDEDGITRRWQAIRSDDCAEYNVPRCEERLDQASRETIGAITDPDD